MNRSFSIFKLAVKAVLLICMLLTFMKTLFGVIVLINIILDYGFSPELVFLGVFILTVCIVLISFVFIMTRQICSDIKAFIRR